MYCLLGTTSILIGCLPGPDGGESPPMMRSVENRVTFGGAEATEPDVNLTFGGEIGSAGAAMTLDASPEGGASLSGGQSSPTAEADEDRDSDEPCYVCGDNPSEILICGEDPMTRPIELDGVCAIGDAVRACVDPQTCCSDGARFDGRACRCDDGLEGMECGPMSIRPVVTLATFNVRLFFDDRCQSRDCPEGFEEQPSTSVFQAKAKQLARAIDALAIDGICLQEVENQRALDAITAELEDDRLELSVMGTTDAGGGIDVAFTGRGDLLDVTRHRNRLAHTFANGETVGFVREFLQVDFNVDDTKVVMFCAHFIAKSGGEDRFWRDPYRRAEATAAHGIMKEVASDQPESLIVLGGDLNDVPGSTALSVFEDDSQFRRVAAELSDGRDATHQFGALDHLYLLENGAFEYVPGSVQVLRSGQRGYAGSDHAALKASFRGQTSP
ncbi:MAG: hypothetical protein VX589_18645 [Myxococcota bacterium]|nr:hypothetical protein [Myxococcota bacterium]